MKSRIFLISLFSLFIILNLIPTYLWMWGFSLVDLERPEYSNIDVNNRDTITTISRIIILIGLWIPILIVFLKRYWNIKALISPTLVSMTLFLTMYISQDVYPTSETEYTEEGYQHRIEKWTEPNQTTIKHWKSQDSLKNHLTHRHIKWELISEEIKD